MNKDSILAALPTLTRADLEAVHATAASLLGARGAMVASTATSPAADLFEALSGHLNVTAAYATVAGTKPGKLLIKNAPAAYKFFNAHFPGWDESRVTKLAFLHMFADLLVSDLKERGVTPTFGIIVANLIRLPEVFENAFPGYLENGMGHLVVKNITKTMRRK